MNTQAVISDEKSVSAPLICGCSGIEHYLFHCVEAIISILDVILLAWSRGCYKLLVPCHGLILVVIVPILHFLSHDW